MKAQLADGRILEFPDGTAPEVVQATVKRIVTGGSEPAPEPVKIGKEGFGDALRETLGEQSWMGRNLAGAGTAASNIWQGAKQMVGKGDDQAIEANRIMSQEAPVGALAGNLALLAPTAMIPGANTVAGAGVIGAAQGAFQPTMGNESRLQNAALGGALGAGSQYGGQKLGQALQKYIANSNAARASAQTQNAVRDATLKAGQNAGYVVPPSAANPSFITNRLESIGGKAAVGQEAALRNQGVTNQLARKAVGLADDTPITEETLKALRKDAGKAYGAVAGLPVKPAESGSVLMNKVKVAEVNPAALVQELKQSRNDAQAWFRAYNRSASPDDLAKAKAADALSKQIDRQLEKYTSDMGRSDLLPALRESRKLIAKTYDLGRAVNEATGDVSAPVLGRLLDKGKPLSGELETIAKFSKAFPAYTRDGAKIPTPGVSKSEALAGAGMAMAGQAMTGNAAGALAGGLPLVSGPARSLALAKALQSMPSYSQPLTQKALKNLTPDRAALLARALASTGLATQ